MGNLVDKTQKELLQELHQGVYGIKDTIEKGLLGDVKELVIQVKLQNDRIRKNERRIYKMWGVLIGVGFAAGTGVGLGLRILGIG